MSAPIINVPDFYPGKKFAEPFKTDSVEMPLCKVMDCDLSVMEATDQLDRRIQLLVIRGIDENGAGAKLVMPLEVLDYLVHHYRDQKRRDAEPKPWPAGRTRTPWGAIMAAIR